jgi:HK97 family phage portal protein
VKVFKWLQPKEPEASTTLQEPEFFRQASLLGEAGSSINVDPNTALSISTVYACVRVIAETVASLPVHVYQRRNGTRIRVETHPLEALLGVSANGEQTAMEMREFMMTSLGLRGNAYCHISRSNRGGVASISPLKPGYMRVSRGNNQRLLFNYEEPNNEGVYGENQIWRVAGLSSDGVTGLSPIALARETLGLSVAMERSANRMFSNGSQTSMTLEFDHTLTEDQIENLRSQWAENYAGWKNAHKPLILESGMKASPIGMNSTDAQFLEQRKAQVTDICRWYRVPPHMVGDLDRATFSNIEHQSIEFVTHTIRPWLVRLEQSMARDLLSESERRSGLYVQHTVEGLLRGDTKSRYDSYATAITNGWMSRNEVRKLENMNPEQGLDDFIVPLNMTNARDTQDLADAENRALVKESKRSPEEFAAWLPGFLERRSQVIGERLGIDASSYPKARITRMADFTDPSDAVSAAIKHTQADIEAIINE